jgi:hypothetical protein
MCVYKRDDDLCVVWRTSLADARRCLCTESRTTATRLTAGRARSYLFRGNVQVGTRRRWS